MKKLLYIGDSPTKQTGFGRVTENLIPELQKHFDVTLFGINYHNESHTYPYRIIPATGPNLEYLQTSAIGSQYIAQAYMELQPDIVVMNNDVWVVNDFFLILKKLMQMNGTQFYAYCPIDGGPYHPKLTESIQEFDGFATYTEFGKTVVKESCGVESTVIPHGTNTKDFFPIDRDYARKQLGLPKDVFLILNGNRNQPRKRYDIMVKGFAEFLDLLHMSGKTNENVALFPHGGVKSRDGWNVPVLLERELHTRKLPLDKQYIFQYSSKPYPHNQVSIEKLNLIYNACDIGINTCYGEGWGLVNSEHAACGVLQMVPDHSSLGELFGPQTDPKGLLVPVSYWLTERGYLLERGMVDSEVVGTMLYDYYTNSDDEIYDRMIKRAYEFFTSKYLSWENVSNMFTSWVLNIDK